MKKFLIGAVAALGLASSAHAQNIPYRTAMADMAMYSRDASVAEWCGLRPHGYSSHVGVFARLLMQKMGRQEWPGNRAQQAAAYGEALNVISLGYQAGIDDLQDPTIGQSACRDLDLSKLDMIAAAGAKLQNVAQ